VGWRPQPSGRRRSALAYNLGNFLRTLATPEPIKDWSLTAVANNPRADLDQLFLQARHAGRSRPTQCDSSFTSIGVVHILVSGKAAKCRLQCVPTILATASVGQNITRHLGQAEYVVEFAIGERPGIGGHHGTAKLEHQSAVKIEPKSIRFRFTRPWRYRRRKTATC
jgi:hypothetical protein